MSTKKLQHTVIEGGRTNRNKWDRRNSYSLERLSKREFCRRVTIDSEASDDISINERKNIYKEFNDKLGPMYRWLHSQVGKPWKDIYSQIRKKFDARTTAGRHILFDHLLRSVQLNHEYHYNTYHYHPDNLNVSYYHHDFYVDDNGVLREKEYISRNSNKPPKFNTQSIANWLHGRIVGKVGNKLFWFMPVDKNKKYGGIKREWKTIWKYDLMFFYNWQKPIYAKNKEGILEIIDYELVWSPTNPNLRQDRKLLDKEMIFWNSIPEWYQTKILEYSPTYPHPRKFDYWHYNHNTYLKNL